MKTSGSTTAHAPPTLLLAVALALTGCGDGEPPSGAAVQRTDSAGITVVHLPSLDTPEAWSLAEAPTLRIGTEEGTELFRVNAATRLPSGRIAVANSGTAEVFVFDGAGAKVASFGGTGEGPGEFRSIQAVVPAPGDSVAVYDRSSSRLSLFDAAGELGRTETLDPPPGNRTLTLQGRPASDRLLASAAPSIGPEAEPGFIQPPFTYVTYGLDGALLDTVARTEGPVSYLESPGEGMIMISSVPFAPQPVAAAGDSLVVLANTDVPSLRIHALSGELLEVVRLPSRARAVTDDLYARFVEAAVESIEERDMRDQVRERMEGTPRVETTPELEAVMVDAAGRIWIQDDVFPWDETTRWTALGPDRAPLARLDLPRDVQLYEIGDDWVLLKRTDDLGVEVIELYELRTGTPAGSS